MNLCITKAEEGLATSDFRLQTSDLRLHTSNFRLQTWQSSNSKFLISTKAEEGLPTSDFRLKTSYFKLQTSDLTKFELRVSDFWPLRLNAAWLDFWPPTSHFLLPTSHFWLPISNFRLPSCNFPPLTSDFRLDSSVRLDCRSIRHARVLRPIHTRDFAPGACSRGTLREQSSSVCTNDFMGILHPREQNFHPAKCSTIFNRLNIWEQAPGANWANLKTLPRVFWHVQNEPGACSGSKTPRVYWPLMLKVKTQ